jgi:hypothetical protein
MGLIAIIVLIGVLGAGFLYTRLKISRLEEERELVNQYISKFRKFSQTYHENFDEDLYSWLSFRAIKIQTLTSATYVLRKLSPESREGFHRKRESLMGTLEQMVQRPATHEKVTSVTSFLMFYLGGIDEYIKDTAKQQWNPIILFRAGVEFVLLTIVTAFKWTSDGDSGEVRNQILESRRFKSWTALITVIAFFFPALILAFGWSTLSGFVLQAAQWISSIFWSLVATLEGLIQDR